MQPRVPRISRRQSLAHVSGIWAPSDWLRDPEISARTSLFASRVCSREGGRRWMGIAEMESEVEAAVETIEETRSMTICQQKDGVLSMREQRVGR